MKIFSKSLMLPGLPTKQNQINRMRLFWAVWHKNYRRRNEHCPYCPRLIWLMPIWQCNSQFASSSLLSIRQPSAASAELIRVDEQFSKNNLRKKRQLRNALVWFVWHETKQSTVASGSRVATVRLPSGCCKCKFRWNKQKQVPAQLARWIAPYKTRKSSLNPTQQPLRFKSNGSEICICDFIKYACIWGFKQISQQI